VVPKVIKTPKTPGSVSSFSQRTPAQTPAAADGGIDPVIFMDYLLTLKDEFYSSTDWGKDRRFRRTQMKSTRFPFTIDKPVGDTSRIRNNKPEHFQTALTDYLCENPEKMSEVAYFLADVQSFSFFIFPRLVEDKRDMVELTVQTLFNTCVSFSIQKGSTPSENRVTYFKETYKVINMLVRFTMRDKEASHAHNRRHILRARFSEYFPADFESTVWSTIQDFWSILDRVTDDPKGTISNKLICILSFYKCIH